MPLFQTVLVQLYEPTLLTKLLGSKSLYQDTKPENIRLIKNDRLIMPVNMVDSPKITQDEIDEDEKNPLGYFYEPILKEKAKLKTEKKLKQRLLELEDQLYLTTKLEVDQQPALESESTLTAKERDERRDNKRQLFEGRRRKLQVQIDDVNKHLLELGYKVTPKSTNSNQIIGGVVITCAVVAVILGLTT